MTREGSLRNENRHENDDRDPPKTSLIMLPVFESSATGIVYIRRLACTYQVTRMDMDVAGTSDVHQNIIAHTYRE